MRTHEKVPFTPRAADALSLLSRSSIRQQSFFKRSNAAAEASSPTLQVLKNTGWYACLLAACGARPQAIEAGHTPLLYSAGCWLRVYATMAGKALRHFRSRFLYAYTSSHSRAASFSLRRYAFSLLLHYDLFHKIVPTARPPTFVWLA